MKRTPILATLVCALTLAGCAAAPIYAPPDEAAQPYLSAHWGHYYRGPYYR